MAQQVSTKRLSEMMERAPDKDEEKKKEEE
jgi:hypothetical protein